MNDMNQGNRGYKLIKKSNPFWNQQFKMPEFTKVQVYCKRCATTWLEDRLVPVASIDPEPNSYDCCDVCKTPDDKVEQ